MSKKSEEDLLKKRVYIIDNNVYNIKYKYMEKL